MYTIFNIIDIYTEKILFFTSKTFHGQSHCVVIISRNMSMNKEDNLLVARDLVDGKK